MSTRVGRQTIPSRSWLVISFFSAVLLAAVTTAGALVVGGGGWSLAPLSFSKIIAATDATPTASTPTKPLAFIRNRPYQLWPRQRHRHPERLSSMLSTTMTMLVGHVADFHGSGKTEETTIADSVSNYEAGNDESTSPIAIEAVLGDSKKKTVAVHTYKHHRVELLPGDAVDGTLDDVHSRSHNLTLMGVGMPPRQFASWVYYYLTHMTIDGEATMTTSTSITTTTSTPFALGSVTVKSTVTTNIQQAVMEVNREGLNEILQYVSTQEFDWDNEWEGDKEEEIVKEEETTWLKIRQFWNEGKLICANTNLVSSSRGGGDRRRRRRNRRRPMHGCGVDELAKSTMVDGIDADEVEEEQRYREEKFRNALGGYAERLVSIVEDELGDASDAAYDGVDEEYDVNKLKEDSDMKQQRSIVALPRWTTSNRLLSWIEIEYGFENTQRLMADSLLIKSEKEQLKTFQSFLDWFRSHFPYFHDKCDSCGVSCKDDPDQLVNGNPKSGDSIVEPKHVDQQNVEDTVIEDFSFLGCVRPTPSELRGGASRTELYRCRSCLSYTRFPRYNKALWVTTTRRGRCGEYSMLLFRMLRALGFVAVRWCVDWADHVWVEVWLGEKGGRWVHLDPCEAAVDNPLLYESWGKNQTFIVAFHDPFYSRSGGRAMRVDWELSGHLENVTSSTMAAYGSQRNSTFFIESDENEIRSHRFPPVEDVTRQYTSDEIHVIIERRGIGHEPVADAIKEVSENLVESLQKLMLR